MKTILLIDDDPAVRNVVRFSLERAGYSVNGVPTAGAAADSLNFRLPDLVILDLTLPDMNGIELLQAWRKTTRTSTLPVIILTGRSGERDRIAGLRSGADDYVVKPFSRDELLARIEAVLKRTRPEIAHEIIEIKGLRLDATAVQVTVNDRTVPVGPIEFRLLRLFMSQPNRVHTRGEIIDRVWQSNVYVEPRSVDVQIRRLRRLLEETAHDHLIETVRGVGYRFAANAQTLPENLRRMAANARSA